MDTIAPNPEQVVGEIFALLDGPPGQEQYGEGVTQLAHALQCAWFASAAGADEETVLAALLHDIGHLCAPDAARMGHNDASVGAVDHEGLGAAYLLERGFSPRLAELVGAHVAAKRYRVATDPQYAARLSPASAETLRYQGGPMAPDEVVAFEADPLFAAKLQMREWDEMGKEVGMVVPTLETYRTALLRDLTRSLE